MKELSKEELLAKIENLEKTVEKQSEEIVYLEKSRKETSTELEKYRDVFDNIIDTYYETDTEGKIYEFGSSVENLLGYKREEMIGRSVIEFYANPKEREELIKKASSLNNVNDFETTLIKKNGEFVDVLVTATFIKDDLNNKTKIKGIIRDISDRKKIENELRQRNNEYERMLNTLIDVYCETDLDGKIIEISPSVEKYSGYKREYFIGKSAGNFHVFSDEWDTLRYELLDKGFFIDKEIRLLNYKNEIVHMRLTSYVEKDSDDKPIYVRHVIKDISERKIAEAELKNSEERFKMLFKMAPDTYFMTDLQGVVIDGNEAAETMTGYNREELVGKTWQELKLVSEDNFEKATQFLSATIKRKSNKPMEFVLNRKDGKQVDVEVVTHIVNINGNEVILGLARNITERKVAEKKVADTLALLETIIKKSPVPMVLQGTSNYSWNYANEAALELLELKVPDRYHINQYAEMELTLLNKEMMNKFGYTKPKHSDDSDTDSEKKVMKIFNSDGSTISPNDSPTAKALKGIETRNKEIILERADGKRIWELTTALPIYNNYGKQIAALTVFPDITQLKATEIELRDTLTQLETVIEQSPIPMFLVSLPGLKLSLINKASAELMGIKNRESAIGKKISELKLSNVAYKAYDVVGNEIKQDEFPMWKALKGIATIDMEIVFKDNDSRPKRYMKITSVPIYNSGGEQIAALNVTNDITELKVIEDELRQSRDNLEVVVAERTEQLVEAKQEAEKANLAKSRFLANMSHEIRTPLNAILGYTQLMRRDESLNADLAKNLKTISKSGEHLLELINDVLEFSKIEAGRIKLNSQHFNLHNLVDSIESMFRLRAESKHINFICQYNELPQFIYTDESKLRQILINLLGNALKFTMEGNIALNVSVKQKIENKYQLNFIVEDTGIGISESDMEKVFEMFEQADNEIASSKGTGLGLAISKKFANMLGGDITFKSQLGKGSIFTCSITVNKGDSTKIVKTDNVQNVIHLKETDKKYKILVVDDKEDNRKYLLKTLELVGFETNEASNGQEAVKTFTEWEPDLILMDLKMPVLDGIEATKQIRKFKKGTEVPIIAVTASAFEEDRNRILSESLNDFIRKPFKEDEMFGTLKKHLNVEYIYADKIVEESRDSKKPEAFNFDPNNLLKLSEKLITQLREAIIKSDLEEFDTLLTEVRGIDKDMSVTLKYLAENFQYDKLLSILKI